MRPPALAYVLLLAVAGEDAEYLAGDLEEEFAQVCQARTRRAGERWYWWQVVRSVAPLLGLRMKSGELRQAAAGALLGVAIPLLLLDRMWSFVYSQIPLKDGIARAPEFLAVNVFCVCLGAAIGGSMRKSTSGAGWTAAAAGFALWLSAGAAPTGYACLVLFAAPASSVITHVWRKAR